MRGIVLCSGGLDSSLALIKMMENGHSCVPMFCDYNQYPADEERYAVEKIWQWCSDNRLSKTLEGLAEVKISYIGDSEKVGSVWGRGIALVGAAAMWAYTHGDNYDFIALGNHKGDVGPDCKPGTFDETLDVLLRQSTKNKMHIELPIKDLTVEEIGIELNQRGIDFKHLYSCYWSPSCGFRSVNDKYLCPGCRRKTIAMKAAGIAEGIGTPNCEKRSYQSKLAEGLGY